MQEWEGATFKDDNYQSYNHCLIDESFDDEMTVKRSLRKIKGETQCFIKKWKV